MPELFENFAVDRQPRWPIVLRLLCGSVVLHLALAAGVIYIPTARDVFGIAAMAGRSRSVDRPYTKTVIGEDIHMVQIGGRFHYPVGYFAGQVFAAAAPSPSPTPDLFAPRIVSEAKDWKPEKPLLSPSPSPSPVPIAANPAASPTPAKTADEQAQDKAREGLHKAAAENNVVVPGKYDINTRPLKDWLARSNEMRENNQLDLEAVVEITIEAQLTTNCILSQARVVQKSGDPNMIVVVTDLASAISDSNILWFLKDPAREKVQATAPCDPGPLRLILKLDQNEVNARVESQAASSERAAQLTSVYNVGLVAGQILKKDKDEAAIYRNTKITSEGTRIIVHFNMPRPAAGALLKKQVEPKPPKAS